MIAEIGYLRYFFAQNCRMVVTNVDKVITEFISTIVPVHANLTGTLKSNYYSECVSDDNNYHVSVMGG